MFAYRRGLIAEDLAGHCRYFLSIVLPHIRDGGQLPQSDWITIQQFLFKVAEVTETLGAGAMWDDSFRKGGGNARARGWWRKEKIGFYEAPGEGVVHPGNIYAAAEPETGENSRSGKPVDDLWELEEQARRLLLVEEEVVEKPTRKGMEKATSKTSKQREKTQGKKKGKGEGNAKAYSPVVQHSNGKGKVVGRK
jgi:hypothetical protein